MDTSRIDRIKVAWMERYGKTEEEWVNFIPATPPRTSNLPIEETIYFDNPNEIHFEHPLCPTYEELGRRTKKTADYYRDKAKALAVDSPVQSSYYREDAERYQRIADAMFEYSDDRNRKGR